VKIIEKKTITIVKREVNQGLIAALEKKLAEAKSGEIIGWAGVALWHDNTTSNHWSSGIQTAHASRVVGELHMLIVDFTCASQQD